MLDPVRVIESFGQESVDRSRGSYILSEIMDCLNR